MHCGPPTGGGGRARPSITPISSGGEGRAGRAAGQGPAGSFLHEGGGGGPRGTKQKGAFHPEEEKDITLLLDVSLSFPGWEVYLMQG